MSVRTEHSGGLALGRPGDAVYAEATATFNLAARVRPAAATVARSTDEVVDAVRQARSLGMPVRVAATGHGATAKSPLDDALLIRTEIGGGVRVDRGARTAVVPAGATWAAVVAAASGHGLAAVHGSAGSVGAVGYLLRGGISFYGRRFGLGANSLRSVTVVLADGEIRVASAEHDPELFWAVRGGGGGFGVVTEVEVDLHPMAAIVTGATVWGVDAAQAIASRWARWTQDAPPEVSTSLRLMDLQPAPGIPSLLTAGRIVVLDGAVAAETPAARARAEDVAAGLLAPLRAVAEPIMDTWHTTDTPVELLQTHMDPPAPLPYLGSHLLLDDLGDEGVASFVAAAGPGTDRPLMIAELRQLGGALAVPARPGGAFDRTAAAFAHIGIGAVRSPGGARSVQDDLDRVSAALDPWNTGMTVPSVVENHAAAQRTYDDRTARDVDVVRRRVDPEGVFRGDVDPIRDRVAVVAARP